MIAQYLARKVGEKTDKGLVAPVVPFGHALYHADFPGTMAVSQTTLATYVKEVCDAVVEYILRFIDEFVNFEFEFKK